MRGKDIHCELDEVVIVRNNWEAEAEALGTTVSSSNWEWTGGGSTASASVSGNETSITLTPTSSGDIVNAVIFADGECKVIRRAVYVRG